MGVGLGDFKANRMLKKSMRRLEEFSKRRVEEAIDVLVRNPSSGRPLKGRLRGLRKI